MDLSPLLILLECRVSDNERRQPVVGLALFSEEGEPWVAGYPQVKRGDSAMGRLESKGCSYWAESSTTRPAATYNFSEPVPDLSASRTARFDLLKTD